MELRRRMARASLDDRVGKGRALADKYLDAAGVERIVRHELGIDEVELRALLDMHLQLVLAALALRQHDFILLACKGSRICALSRA